MKIRLCLILPLIALSVRAEELIPSGQTSEWRYAAGGEALADWNTAKFADSAGAKGPAPPGYGEEGLATKLPATGKDGKPVVTAWFRKAFEVKEAAPEGTSLMLSLRADDGAVVYLNGGEIARFNMPEGKPGAETLAEQALSSGEESVPRNFKIKTSALAAGQNVVAVEVHQASPESSDLVLDLSLRRNTPWPEIKPVITDASRPATMAYYQKHFIPPGMKVPDGYVDGGRRMVVGKNAAVASTREILVIDRSRDPSLRKHLEHAKDPELLKLPTEERARSLARYVDKTLSPGGDRQAALEAVETFTEEYANRAVLFGEMEEVCQSGVCRHRALLFKMLCDEAGLKSALVRGNYNAGLTRGGHAWNELLLDDGSRVIVDVMNPKPGFAFLPETDKEAKAYLSVKNEVIYPRKADDNPSAAEGADKP